MATCDQLSATCQCVIAMLLLEYDCRANVWEGMAWYQPLLQEQPQCQIHSAIQRANTHIHMQHCPVAHWVPHLVWHNVKCKMHEVMFLMRRSLSVDGIAASQHV